MTSLLLSAMIIETPDWFSDENWFFRMFQNWLLMHIAWILMKITVSELKQPWSVLLQSKNSEIFRAGTAIIRTENLWSLLKITEHCLTLMKISENYWKCLRTALNIYETSGHLWKGLNIARQLGKFLLVSENVWISPKTTISTLKRFENLCWRALFIAEWSSDYVLSTF